MQCGRSASFGSSATPATKWRGAWPTTGSNSATTITTSSSPNIQASTFSICADRARTCASKLMCIGYSEPGSIPSKHCIHIAIGWQWSTLRTTGSPPLPEEAAATLVSGQEAFAQAFMSLVQFAEVGEGNLDFPAIVDAPREIGAVISSLSRTNSMAELRWIAWRPRTRIWWRWASKTFLDKCSARASTPPGRPLRDEATAEAMSRQPGAEPQSPLQYRKWTYARRQYSVRLHLSEKRRSWSPD